MDTTLLIVVGLIIFAIGFICGAGWMLFSRLGEFHYDEPGDGK